MKFLALASVLFLSGTNAYNMPRPECEGVDRRGKVTTCNKMQQENRDAAACKNNGKVMREIKFTKLQICSNDDYTIGQIMNSANYEILLRGPAVQRSDGSDVLVTKDMLGSVKEGPGCLTATWTMEVDTCQPYFEAEFRAWDGSDTDNKFSFVKLDDNKRANDGQFMRRTCDLRTEMTCTGPDGDICDDLNVDMCTSGNTAKTSGIFTYSFCYANMEREHEVTVRKYYTKCDQDPNPEPTSYEDRRNCTETHTFYNETLINPDLIPASGPAFPGNLVLPPNPDGSLKTCFTYTRTFDACKDLLPDARLNVVGSVTRAVRNTDRTAAPTRFRACYDQTRVEAVNIKLRDANGNTITAAPTTSPTTSTAPSAAPFGAGEGKEDTGSPTASPNSDCASSSKGRKSCKSKAKGNTRGLRKKRRNDRKDQDRF